MQVQTSRIASLDGLRAISIGLVIFGHLAGTRGFPVNQIDGDLIPLAKIGVQIFFVISGFLITTLLVQESNKTGTINLLKFYFRRTLRIFPPYYALILAVILLRQAGLIAISNSDIFHAVTYTSNYFFPTSWYLGHTWSLSIEEQFYLLWPFALSFLGQNKARFAIIAVLFLCPGIRTLSMFGIWHTTDSTAFEMLADALAWGCVLALWRDQLHLNRMYQWVLRHQLFWLLPICALGLSSFQYSTKMYYSVGLSFINLTIALCIDWSVTWSEGRVGKLLNAKPIAYIGTLSYSIYLWQQLFLNRHADSLVTSFPLNLILAGIVALGSYYLIEKPSLQWRQRLEAKLFAR